MKVREKIFYKPKTQMFQRGDNMVHKIDGDIIDLINHNWELIARFAFECYVYGGRGATVIHKVDALTGSFCRSHFVHGDSRWPNRLNSRWGNMILRTRSYS
jgi:hypothetical protein